METTNTDWTEKQRAIRERSNNNIFYFFLTFQIAHCGLRPWAMDIELTRIQSDRQTEQTRQTYRQITGGWIDERKDGQTSNLYFQNIDNWAHRSTTCPSSLTPCIRYLLHASHIMLILNTVILLYAS